MTYPLPRVTRGTTLPVRPPYEGVAGVVLVLEVEAGSASG
jgi:hypothetical protein